MPYTAAELGRAIFEESGDALFLLEPDTDRLVDVNRTAEKLTGFRKPELLSKPSTHWFRYGSAERGADGLRRAASETVTFHSREDYYVRTPEEGVWVPVNLTVTRLHLPNKTLALITARDIREQRETYNQLQRAESELRRVTSSIPDCLWSAEVDAAGWWQYRYFSSVVMKITGRLPGSFLGGAERWRAVVHPEDRGRWDQVTAKLRRGRPAQHEYRVLTTGGEVRWVRESVSASGGQDGQPLRLDGVLTDVTEARLASEEHDRLFELSVDMLCVAGFDGYFKRVNPAWERTLGWPEEALLASPYMDFVHPDDREATAGEAQRLVEGGDSISFENRYRCLDGSYKWLLWNAAPLQARQLVYAAARDITRRKQSEVRLKETADELERLVRSEREAHQQLKQAQSRLVQSEKLVALGQMVAGVAHEINNPLAFVTNNLVVLKRDVDALNELFRRYQAAECHLRLDHPQVFKPVREYAEGIDADYTLESLPRMVERTGEGLRRIRQIVRDLRDFARLDESELQEADLNAGVESTLNIVHGRGLKKQIKFETDLQPLPTVHCYSAKINQVILNLVANAIDACPPEGKVMVRTRAVEGGVEIHVEDTGHGIDPAIRDKIFDPFFTTKPPGMGTGLGLSISHGIVEDHGGSLDVESEPGKGAHFVVRLPLRVQKK